MRALALLAVAVLALSGCASDPDGDQAAVQPEKGQAVFEGKFTKTHVQGQEVSREGGTHDLQVAGWRNVLVTFDINIEAHLILLPPECAGQDAPCALLFTDEDATSEGKTWLVPDMQDGGWKILIDLKEGSYTMASSPYTITFDYIVA